MGTSELRLRAMFAKYGYGVIACLEPTPAGYVISGVNVGDMEPSNTFYHPLVTTVETTKDEWDEQGRLSNTDISLNPAYKYFYRVVTD